METMTINANELACELANKKLVEIYKEENPNLSDDEIDELILVEDEDEEMSTYSDEAQEIFDLYFNEYFNMIETYKI